MKQYTQNILDVQQTAKFLPSNQVPLQSKSQLSTQEKQQLEKIQNSLVDVFLELKATLDQSQFSELKKLIPLDSEKPFFQQQDQIILIYFLKQILNHFVKSNQELDQKIQKQRDKECSDYEASLQKLEAEIREHIRIEQQMKLYAENTLQKLEDTQKQKSDLEKFQSDFHKNFQKQQDQLKEKDKEIEKLKKQFDNVQETGLKTESKLKQNGSMLKPQTERQPITENSLTNHQPNSFLFKKANPEIDPKASRKQILLNSHNAGTQLGNGTRLKFQYNNTQTSQQPSQISQTNHHKSSKSALESQLLDYEKSRQVSKTHLDQLMQTQKTIDQQQQLNTQKSSLQAIQKQVNSITEKENPSFYKANGQVYNLVTQNSHQVNSQFRTQRSDAMRSQSVDCSGKLFIQDAQKRSQSQAKK